jgi:glycosyltransferase involved in cell wall biosynthesis
LILIPYFYPSTTFGGPVTIAYEVGKELVQRGHEVVVFTTDAKNLNERFSVKNEQIDGMNVYYFRNTSMFFVKHSMLFIAPELSKRLKQQLRSFDVIYVHEYSTYQNIILHKLAKTYHVPYVIQTHGSMPIVGRYLRRYLFDILFGYKILKDSASAIALNQTEVNLYKKAGILPSKIHVIPNGIKISDYELNILDDGFFSKHLNIPVKNKVILYLGRLHKSKGLDLLLKAYAILVREKKIGNLNLVIVGPDDGYLGTLKSLSSSLKISDSVIFSGFLEKKDKISAMRNAEIFVTPCFYGFPLTFLEACAAGLPIVTTSMGDTLDWVDRVGYVTSPDVNELADAMYAILSNDHVREDFSKKCLSICSEFSLAKIVNQFESVFNEVATKK